MPSEGAGQVDVHHGDAAIGGIARIRGASSRPRASKTCILGGWFGWTCRASVGWR